MLLKIKLFIKLVSIMMMVTSVHADQVNQGYFIYQQGTYTIARGRVINDILIKNPDSATVFQSTLKQLEANGGELKIENGTYIINKPLDVPSHCKITGSGRATVLKLGNENKDGIILKIDTKEEIVICDLTLQGIKSHGRSAGIILDQAGDCEVRDIYARDFSAYGIWTRNNSFMNKIVNTTTSGNNKAGIFFDTNTWKGKGRGGDFVPNLVIGCTSLGDNGNAFQLDNCICTNFVGCIAYQPKQYGFFLNGSNSTLITGCRTYQCFRGAVYAKSSHELNISSNIFCWHKGTGIEINNVTWAVISGNEIIDSGGVGYYDENGNVDATAYGIKMHTDTKCVQVTGNTLFCWGDGHKPMINGIYESGDCKDNQITNNAINFYDNKAVLSKGTNTIVDKNLGIRKFYTEAWKGPFQKEKDKPTQLLEPFTRDKVDAFLEQTRK